MKKKVRGLWNSIRGRLIALVCMLMGLFFAVTIVTFALVGRREISSAVESGNMYIIEQTKKLIDDRLQSLLEQAVAFSNSYHLMDVIGSMANPKPIDPMQYVKVNNDLEEMYMFNTSIVQSLFLYLNKGDVLYYKGDGYVKKAQFQFENWYERFSDGEFHWINVGTNPFIETTAGDVPSAELFYLIGRPDAKLNGIFLISIKEAYFDRVFAASQQHENSYFAIISPDGEVFSKPYEASYALDDSLIRRILEGGTAANFRHALENGHRAYISYDTLDFNGWKLALITSEQDVFASLNKTTALMLIWVLVIFGLGIIISMVFSRAIITPVLLLTEKVHEVEGGNLDVVFDIKPHNEIQKLNNGIGFLVLRVKKLISDLKEEIHSKRNAELSLLQAQINPHFLYNTLYSIKQLCDMNDPRTASLMIGKLSEFYRIGISRGRELITIKEEMQHIESYLAIQAVRSNNDFSFSFDVSPQILNQPILKLTLQPLVENAIYHGIKPLRGSGTITVTGGVEQGNIVLKVRDTGVGMEEEQLEKIRKLILGGEAPDPKDTKTSYGLRNVNDRLRMQFGDAYGLNIDSRIDEFTQVTVILPFSEKEEGERQ